MSVRRSLVLLIGAVLLTASLTACGDDDDTASDSTTTTEAPKPGVEVEGAWARTSPMDAKNGAAYMVLTSTVDDALVGASVAPTVAAKTEVHETVPVDSDSSTTMMSAPSTTMMAGSGTTMMAGSGNTMPGNPEMMMRPVAQIELPAGEAVELKPGGYHVMLIDLVAPLEVGSTVQVTLQFEKADPMTVDVPVRDDAP